MTATEIAPELSTRLDSIIEDETETFLDRQRRSQEMSERAPRARRAAPPPAGRSPSRTRSG